MVSVAVATSETTANGLLSLPSRPINFRFQFIPTPPPSKMSSVNEQARLRGLQELVRQRQKGRQSSAPPGPLHGIHPPNQQTQPWSVQPGPPHGTNPPHHLQAYYEIFKEWLSSGFANLDALSKMMVTPLSRDDINHPAVRAWNKLEFLRRHCRDIHFKPSTFNHTFKDDGIFLLLQFSGT